MPTNKNPIGDVDLLTKTLHNGAEHIDNRFYAAEKLAYMQIAKEFNIDKNKARGALFKDDIIFIKKAEINKYEIIVGKFSDDINIIKNSTTDLNDKARCEKKITDANTKMNTIKSPEETLRDQSQNVGLAADLRLGSARKLACFQMAKEFNITVETAKKVLFDPKESFNILKNRVTISRLDETETYAKIVAEYSSNLDTIGKSLDTNQNIKTRIKESQKLVEQKFKESGRWLVPNDNEKKRGEKLIQAKDSRAQTGLTARPGFVGNVKKPSPSNGPNGP